MAKFEDLSHEDRSLVYAIRDRFAAVNRIQDAWLIYLTHAVPMQASSYQKLETEKAYWAGAEWVFRTVVVKWANLPQEEMIKLLEAMGEEIDAYGKSLADE